MRRAGILLNISTLPNCHGIGGFGTELEEFTIFLKKTDCTLWQMLPLTTIGQGNSPYSSISAFAGNYLYIDSGRLRNAGLISDNDYDNTIYNGSPYTVDYEFATASKRAMIRAAQRNVDKFRSQLVNFCEHSSSWLIDYASFMTIKELNNYAPWWEWKDEKLKTYSADTIAEFTRANQSVYEYYLIEQYLFDLQWRDAKALINASGIKVMGDMPIYVSRDSSDVWANSELFQLDSDLLPTAVAGVPPDYFAKEGQLWGNPLYDYDIMAKDNFAWFTSRTARMFELYDICRFDHFRAVAEYWSVPYGAKNAISGEWKAGGGLPLMQTIANNCHGEIIAEDLGIIDDKVNNLRKALNLKGMKVLQFGWDGDDSIHMPHNYERDSVAYTGTHDNNTLFGWLYECAPTTRDTLFDYIGAPRELSGGKNSSQVWACIRSILTSSADYAIIPFQDLLGWGSDTRMNIPGIADNNWRIRISHDNIVEVNATKLRHLINISKRV